MGIISRRDLTYIPSDARRGIHGTGCPGVVWLVSIVLVEAAVIDGLKRRVPNWLTFHLVLGGLAYAAWTGGCPGLALVAGGRGAGPGPAPAAVRDRRDGGGRREAPGRASGPGWARR